MSSDPRILFLFHAEGHAFSGQFRRPACVSIPAQASTSLPTIGGTAHSRVDKFDVPRLVSFTKGETHVSGSQQDKDTFTTQVTTTIEGLRILDFLTADRIVARLTSEHKRDQKEGHILALGSTFDNLRLGGHQVKVTLRHELFLEKKTFKALHEQVTKEAKSEKIPGLGYGALLCSLVKTIETDLPGVEIKGNVLRVPHFGFITIAEVFAEPGTRTLTMLRFALGSPDDGSGTGGEVRTNGQPPPP